MVDVKLCRRERFRLSPRRKLDQPVLDGHVELRAEARREDKIYHLAFRHLAGNERQAKARLDSDRCRVLVHDRPTPLIEGKAMGVGQTGCATMAGPVGAAVG